MRLRIGCAIAVTVAAIAFMVNARNRADLREAQGQRVLDDGMLRIAVAGDSVAHGAGDENGRGIAGALDAQLQTLRRPSAPALNLGLNGARTRDAYRVVSQSASLIAHTDAVIVSIGGNDLYGDSLARLESMLCPSCAMQRTVSGVKALVARIHQLNPATRVILLGLYNPYHGHGFLDRQVNVWDALLIARFAEDSRVTIVRIADLLRPAGRLSPIDHFHPSALGYSLIAARIAPIL